MPDALLAGFAWVGADLVIGAAGLARHGALPDWGADGCHVICRADGQGHLIATDWRGQARLFLYRHGAAWAVSNSFSALVDDLHRRGRSLTPQRWALAAWLRPATAFDQLPWTATAAAEITLLLPWQALRIQGGRARIVRRPAGPQPVAHCDGAAQVWLSRLLTLLTGPELCLGMDLTGGLDSRTVLSMALHLRATGQVVGLDRLRFASNLGGGADLAVAQALAARHGLRLNDRARDAAPRVALAESLRFKLWRDWSLGQFASPYLPPESIDPAAVELGGHGGEYLRDLPWSPSLRRLIALAAEGGGPPPGPMGYLALLQAWRQAAHAPDLPQARSALRYRWTFRLRQLAGHFPQSRLRINPLAGRDLGAWATHRPRSDLTGGRLHFVLMARLAPDLLDTPFADDAYALPKGLSRGGPPILADPGHVKGWDREPPRNLDHAAAPRAVQLIAQAVEAAIEVGAERLLGPEVLELARAVLAESGPALPVRLAFRPVHAVLVAGLVLGAAPT